MLPLEALHALRRIEIPARKLADEVFSGRYKSSFKGRGMEFSEVREYLPGDDLRIIDWNVTARYGRPFVKKFVEERELTLLLLVDLSGSEFFGSAARTKRDLACELGAILAFSALTNNDKVGLILFTDRIEEYVPPRKGRRHSLRVMRDILAFEPASRGTDLNGAFAFLNDVIRKKAIVFVISDFVAPDFERSLRITARRHDLSAFTIVDPRELSLDVPGKGLPILLSLDDPETGKSRTVNLRDTRFLQNFAETGEGRLRDLSGKFSAAGVDQALFRTDVDYMKELLRFFEKKHRKARY
ncbi:MAG: DUF58 domain-containing protein [bacterium]